MNPCYSKLLIAMAGGAATAWKIDYNAFKTAVEAWKANPVGNRPTFDWGLFAYRLADGLIYGLCAGLGIQSLD